MAIDLPRAIYDEMVAHARRQLPNEACGLLIGRAGDANGARQPDRTVGVTEFRPAPNEAPDPRIRYHISARLILQLEKELRGQGREMVGIFHSHPATPAYPSKTDISLAFYPDAFYVILSLAEPERPVMRAFRIRGEEVTEEPILVDGLPIFPM